ncbi:MAG TPA: S9 family peptidase [Acidobacteriota bacterium]|nr:S9 family peptidase [Acidobacteriota bacterium]
MSLQRRYTMTPRRLLLGAFSLFLALSPAAAQQPQDAPAVQEEKKPFSVEDMLAIKRVSSHAVSPDGTSVVFVLRTTDLEADRGRTNLWIIRELGSPAQQLTSHEASDFNPVWGDDQTVYFLSTRSGSSQVWKIRTDGGEAIQVSDLPLDVTSLVLSRQGDKAALSMEVFPDCETLDCTVQRLAEHEKEQTTGVVYDQLFVRHWDTWKDGRRSHVFLLPLQGDERSPTDLMKGMEADCPSKPFGGPEEYTFTPDGQGLVFTARVVGNEEAWSTNFDLYHAAFQDFPKPRKITKNPAWDTQPVFSPDGRTLAYLAMQRPGFEADRSRITLRRWPEGEARMLTEQWDRSPSSFAFSPDGATLFASAQNLGQHSIFAIDGTSGEAEVVVLNGYNLSPQPASESRIVYSHDNLKAAAELYSVTPGSTYAQQLTEFNDQHLDSVAMGEFEQFAFQGWNDETVHAYVVAPANAVEGREYPVAFLIHGGPQGSFGNHFHYRWNPQAYAGAGYAVVMVDFHGSTGYGQDFTDSITGDWGGKPLVDLQKGLQEALVRYSWMDSDSICALGASYGGYMINWIAGNWSDRFRCLVNHDGLFDMRMMYYVTEELWFPEWEHGGPYWKAAEQHEKHNPANHVENWSTPMLVVHGALDYRVPLGQGLATFTALQRQDVPSKLLFFPDENHWVLSPNNSIQWHNEVLDWLNRWSRE